jgi:hypothetical protein
MIWGWEVGIRGVCPRMQQFPVTPS